VREHVVAAAVAEFNDIKAELSPLLEELGPSALVALVRQHHHLTDADQGWAFNTLEFKQGPERMDGSPGPGVLYGELVESRQSSEGQAMKKVRIFLDPDTIDSIEIETFD
jgi:hypothetical protein